MKVISYLFSLVVISVSVFLLVLVSVASMIINGVLAMLMILGLGIPMLGNNLAGKISQSKGL